MHLKGTLLLRTAYDKYIQDRQVKTIVICQFSVLSLLSLVRTLNHPKKPYWKLYGFFPCQWQLDWNMPHQMNSLSVKRPPTITNILLTILHLTNQKWSLTFRNGCIPSLSFYSGGDKGMQGSFSGFTKHRNGMERNGIYRNTAEWNGMDKNGTGIHRNNPEWRRNETEWTRMAPEYTGTS